MRDELDYAVEINFAGKGRYNRPRQGQNQKGKGTNVRNYPLSVMGCSNWDAPHDMDRECTHPKNNAKVAARKLENHQKRKKRNYVHVLLAHLCRQLDQDSTSIDEYREGSDNDVTIFENVI